MEDSILNSIKKMVGIPQDCDSFDLHILFDINSAFSTLWQLGIQNNGKVESYDQKWNEVFSDYNDNVLDHIKEYTAMKVRLLFDPPSSSYVLDSLTAQISELEWRISEYAEKVFENDSDVDDETCDSKDDENELEDKEVFEDAT